MQIGPMEFEKRELRDAGRLALQSAAAAAAQFALMQAFGMPEKFVGVLSAVLVVQPTVGHTLGASRDRIAATLLGSALGVLCLVALPGGYGTAVALAACMLVINFIAGFFPQWRYGVVAAVALALGSENDLLQTSVDRGIAISLGALVGTLISFVVWPDRAVKRAERHLREALCATADRLDIAVENARDDEDRDSDDARRRYHRAITSARDAADGIRLGDKRDVRRRIEKCERLYNSVLILNRVAEETDRVTGESEQLAEAVETIRRGGHELTVAIAEREASPDEIERALASMREAIEQAREATAEPSDESERRAHVIRNGLVFGLGEVADCLEAFSDPES